MVELPQWLWQPILQGPVLTLRPKKSAHGYEKVWLPEGSPLAVFTERQAAALAQKLPKHIIVREVEYTEPAVKGDTSGKVMKTARLIGGTEVQVMSYVENGDKIEIDTRTGEFRKRA